MSTLFRYKDYEFQINPQTLKLQRARILKAFQPPVQTSNVLPKTQIQDLGLAPMSVSGEGLLIGDDRMRQYTDLYDCLVQGGSGLLHIPGLTPFYCFFEQLSLVGRAGPKLLQYTFLFREDTTKNVASPKMVRDFYISRAGDTLEAIATRFGLTVEQLLERNPHCNTQSTLVEGIMLWI